MTAFPTVFRLIFKSHRVRHEPLTATLFWLHLEFTTHAIFAIYLWKSKKKQKWQHFPLYFVSFEKSSCAPRSAQSYSFLASGCRRFSLQSHGMMTHHQHETTWSSCPTESFLASTWLYFHMKSHETMMHNQHKMSLPLCVRSGYSASSNWYSPWALESTNSNYETDMPSTRQHNHMAKRIVNSCN